jgi:MFS family permease
MCLTVGLVYGAGTILFTALAKVAETLDANQTELQWVSGTYPLVIAALLLPGGAFVDRVGRRVGAILGLSMIVGFFTAASQTTDPRLVILCMALAGIGGAMAFPATLATITAVLPADRRGPAVGIWSISLYMGGIVGTSVGGMISQWLAWPWLFLVPALVALALLPAVLAYVPESRDVSHNHFDRLGATLAFLAVGFFVFGMTEAPSKGWTHPLTLTALVGVGFLVMFVRSQLLAEHPILDVQLFADGRFGTGSILNLATWFLTYGFFFTAVQYRAFTLGLDPVLLGVSFGFAGPAAVPLAIFGPRWARRYGVRPVLTAGAVVMAIGAAGVGWAATTHSLWPVAACEAFLFAGLALSGGPATESIIEALPPAKHGVASAVNDITRQLGVALGVAMLGSLFNVAYRQQIGAHSGDIGTDAVEDIKNSAAAGLALVPSLPEGTQADETRVIENAVSTGFSTAMLAAAVVMTLCAVVVWRRCPRDAGKLPVTVERTALDLGSEDRSGDPRALSDLALAEALKQAALQYAVAAEHYADLLVSAQARGAQLEARIIALEAHEADLLDRYPDLHGDWRRWAAFVDPIAASHPDRKADDAHSPG